MYKRLITLGFMAVAAIMSCRAAGKIHYTVEGTAPNESYNNQKVYIYDYRTKKNTDSAVVVGDKFTIRGSVDTIVIRRLVLKKIYAEIILEEGKISVNMATPESVKGTPLNEELSKFISERRSYGMAYSDRYREITTKQDIDEGQKRQLLSESDVQYRAKVNSLCSKFFNANKNNAVGGYTLWDWSKLLSVPQIDSLYMQTGVSARNFMPLQNVMATVEKKKETSAGRSFIDFTVEHGNIDGSKVSLSDYVGKGKYVLVDFWASWCKPCIAEMPDLGEIYNKYKGDKFEVVGIAISDKRESTIKAIGVHKMTWPQIVDAQDIPTNLYSIGSIPHLIMFGPDGNIIFRNLRGAELKAKLAEIMRY